MKAMFMQETPRGIERFSAQDKLLAMRKIFFSQSVTAESCDELIQYLLCLEDSGSEEVTLYLNSPGGEVISGLAVYDILCNLRCPLCTVCTGTAASMASILFLAGAKRLMFPHTKIMIHDPLLTGLSGCKKALELEREAEQLMETRRILGGIIAERCGRTLEEVFEKTKEDCYLTAEEALDFGIATEIIGRKPI